MGQLAHLCLKYSTITIINSVYSLLLFSAVFYGACYGIHQFMRGEIKDTVEEFKDGPLSEPFYRTTLIFAQMAAPIGPIMAVLGTWLIVKDTLEGRYCPLYLQHLEEDSSLTYT